MNSGYGNARRYSTSERSCWTPGIACPYALVTQIAHATAAIRAAAGTTTPDNGPGPSSSVHDDRTEPSITSPARSSARQPILSIPARYGLFLIRQPRSLRGVFTRRVDHLPEAGV